MPHVWAQKAADSTKTAKARFAMMARSYQDSVWLRWGVSNEAVWRYANQQGYVVERAERPLGSKTPASKLKFAPIEGSPFKVWAEEKWQAALEPLAKTDSQAYIMAGIASGFAEPLEAKPSGDVLQDLKTLSEARQAAENPFAMSMLIAMRSRVAALGLGLRTTDKTAKTGKTYVYRVYCAGKSPMPSDTGYVEVAVKPFVPETAYPNVAISKVESDSSVAFDWLKTPDFFGFYIERSMDGGKTYQRLTATPVVPTYPEGYTGERRAGFGDDEKGIPLYKPLKYRFIGLTPFADEVTFATIDAMRRDKTPTRPPFIASATHTKPEQITITWDMATPVEADLKAFRVKRGSDVKGPFTDITPTPLDKGIRQYIDTQFELGGKNFYQIEAIDTAGNASQSLVAYVTLIDSTAPAKPVFVSGTMDSLGRVTLVLAPNKERDFAGFRILKANGREHEFSAISESYSDSLGFKILTFYDTTQVRTLTRSIFYQATALDRNYNESEPSEILEIKRPDVIRPVKPLMGKYTATDSSVVLSFVRSSSMDVASHLLLRRIVSGKIGAWQTIATLKNPSNPKERNGSYVDFSVQGGNMYEYAMIAIDESGLRSDTSLSITVKPYVRAYTAQPVLKATANAATRSVEIGWQYKSNITATPVFVLMRKVGSDGWSLVSRTEGTPAPVLKDSVPESVKTPVAYMLKVMYPETGQESPFSDTVQVSFQ